MNPAHRALSIVLLLSFASATAGADAPAPRTENEKLNYSVGHQVGTDFRRNGVELEAEQLVQGVRDALKDAEPKISQQEMQKTLTVFKSKIDAADKQRRGAQYKADLKAGREFLEANGKKEGVVTLPGGVQYRVLKEGAGASPAKQDNVSIHYSGSQINGSEFYTTRKGGKPQIVMVGNMIPGIRDALVRMRPGDRWQIFVPGELGYAAGNPLYGKTVIFDVELLEVNPKR